MTVRFLNRLERLQRMRKGQPLRLHSDVKISRSRGQGVSYSVSVLAPCPFIPELVAAPSEVAVLLDP